MVGCSKDSKDTVDSNSSKTSGNTTPTTTPMEELSGKTVLTVNGLDVSYDEVRMYLQSNKEEIESTYGSDVWEMSVNADGKSYEETLKESLLDEIIYIKLVCSQAEALGITLTEDELLDVDEYTADFLSNFDEEKMEYYHVDQEMVRQIYKDNMLSNKVFESLTLNVDTQVSDEEARQAVFQYILVGKYGYDEAGNRYEYTEEQLAEAKARAEALYTQAQETTNFYDFAQANTDDEDEVEIIVGKGDMKAEIEKVTLSMKAGEISPVIDTEDGYFIFYCVEEMNQEETDAKKEEIIRERQQAAFDEQYKKWDEEKEVKINQEIWDAISLSDEIVQ
jgi:foldase protein PrsA